MSGRYLLDTNIIIALFAKEITVQDKLAQADEVFIPSVVLGELYFGAHKSAKATKNIARIDELATNTVTVGCDTETARYYGEIKNALRLLEGLHRFSTGGRPPALDACYLAACPLPGLDFHQQVPRSGTSRR